MIIGICATKNMYPQVQSLIMLLSKTQTSIEHVYVFTEDDLKCNSEDITIINVSNFVKLTSNVLNNKTKYTYMCMTRCYFSELLPEVDKILYLDLDIITKSDISELWNIDMTDYAVAGVSDENLLKQKQNVSYLAELDNYINSGVLLMNLKYIREHGLDIEMHKLLNSRKLLFPDQDAINLVCKDRIKFIDATWNSSLATKVVDDSKIAHCIGVKPWDPNSIWFKEWVNNFFNSIVDDRYKTL